MDRECDILLPAALEQSLNKDNADSIRAKFIVEGGNGISTEIADEIFNKKKILVIPDILANAGGVTVSYFEWLKNIEHKQPGRLTQLWEEKSKYNLLKVIEKKFREQGYKIDLDIFRAENKKLMEGGTDIDLVYSGLKNIMTIALK